MKNLVKLSDEEILRIASDRAKRRKKVTIELVSKTRGGNQIYGLGNLLSRVIPNYHFIVILPPSDYKGKFKKYEIVGSEYKR